MGFGAVPAQGLIGVPDDVPGRDILVPFFYVSMPGFGNDNTIITITEVKGFATNIHYTVYSKNGSVQHDSYLDPPLTLTAYDVLTIDLMTLIDGMSPTSINSLEFDVDADGEKDHLVGYIFFDNISTDENNLISHVYQVDLPGGRAVSYNPPRLEYHPTVGDPRQVFPGTGLFAGNEKYSANALWIGKNLLAGNTGSIPDATFFRLMFRYYIMNENSKNLFIIWVDFGHTGIPVPGALTCLLYNEEGSVRSFPVSIEYGLNILDMGNSLPPSWLQDYPVAGWVDIRTPDVNINGFDANRSWLGYSWQMGSGKASKGKGKPSLFPGRTWWDVIQPADRETDDVS